MASNKSSQKKRVMWLLNHTTLRKFEIDQFRKLGIDEIFLPKFFPFDEGNLSASISYECDPALTIPKCDLNYLNQQNWYEEPSEEAWRLANLYFDVIVVGFFPRQLSSAVRKFHGAIVLRVFGLASNYSYSKLIREICDKSLVYDIKKCAHRFWFGVGYSHLPDDEDHFLSSRSTFLPVGLKFTDQSSSWSGTDKSILFVCPRIETSQYFNGIYKNFIGVFSGVNYKIGGAQPISVDDKNVMGFVEKDLYEKTMTESRVMFYHSREMNHIHYHPFEAIAKGIPLIYMAGGMLDILGGRHLPGRCTTEKEAKNKISRIINDDWGFVNLIKSSQKILLEPMRAENCEKPWQEGFSRIFEELKLAREYQSTRPLSLFRKKIAIIIPIGYKGGSLRGAKLLAQAILNGSCQAGEMAEVVFCHLDDPSLYPEEEFSDMDPRIRRRPFNWRQLTASEARRAMRYAGQEEWEPTRPCYQIPDDGIRQLQDCDLWVVVSDRLTHPLLPIKPAVLMVYDYLQRYVPILPEGADQPYLDAARNATQVWVTTEFTQNDALQYAGVDAHRLRRLPMLAPDFSKNKHALGSANYFLWTTNLAPHKNHFKAIEALRIYYAELGGELKCKVTGVGSKDIPVSKLSHLKSARDLLASSKILQSNTEWLGELPDDAYRDCLSSAVFLWHAGSIDNGTFSVIEAASVGVPSLSSNYQAMREINAQFQLNLAWMDANSPRDMAHRLKEMEQQAEYYRQKLPSAQVLQSQNVEHLAGNYWNAVRECL